MTWCNRGTALEALGRDAEAADSFARALALNPNLPEVHYNLANALLRLEQHEKAVPHYRRAIALRPHLGMAFVNLGRALSALGRWQEAIDSYKQALHLGVASPQLHYAMAVGFEQLGRYEEGLASAENVLVLDPEHVAALNRMGSLLLILGRVEEAQQVLERALSVDPCNSDAYLSLSMLERFVPSDPHLAAMERLAAEPDSTSIEDRIKLHFALGKIYRAAEDYDVSFRHFRQGNALRRGQIQYNEANTIESFDRIAGVFTPGFAASQIRPRQCLQSADFHRRHDTFWNDAH